MDAAHRGDPLRGWPFQLLSLEILPSEICQNFIRSFRISLSPTYVPFRISLLEMHFAHDPVIVPKLKDVIGFHANSYGHALPEMHAHQRCSLRVHLARSAFVQGKSESSDGTLGLWMVTMNTDEVVYSIAPWRPDCSARCEASRRHLNIGHLSGPFRVYRNFAFGVFGFLYLFLWWFRPGGWFEGVYIL